jgi:hypothetical protein
MTQSIKNIDCGGKNSEGVLGGRMIWLRRRNDKGKRECTSDDKRV